MFAALPEKKYAVIYADPPWFYKGSIQHNGKESTGSAFVHYPTVPTPDLKKLPIPEISEKNCILFMWTSNPHLEEAIELGNSWGFKYKTIAFIWNKERPNPGYYTMSECEICLVFCKGSIPKPRGARNIRQFLSEKRREHSKKPDEVRKRIELMFPMQGKIELFAREKAEGWDCWGNEV